ncbi:uncharacterized protein PHACADRAFT_257886 [Phanerochaete carnosa HHB-10118-sp]|uniref:Lectin n=1 Tax=Phanerochaete carnosa (strain HHB-10118-sp) TaxID=650164 RepID=K5WUR4_PHACS|nr:uncharacterized protein PHACADRAFT_257886 [Phanerochaete carnosa HHB-10118-sp]EKM54207.1 hypothetical protein PHACADRAFT_257886 [Phanerochaete carnosa HHB-10118-sp]
MTYTISVRVQSDTRVQLVESSVWHYANGGTWNFSAAPDSFVLTMAGSGTSGMLRFQLPSGELFAIAVGIHNYAPWSGVAVDIGPSDTLQVVHKEFYAGGPRSSPTLKDSVGNSKSGLSAGVLYNDTESNDKSYKAVIAIVI